jgi:MoaA/NifB/PqqE/SkfB family radical SAM enzyme
MVKFFIAYPISFDCPLRCSYCFHHERFYSNYTKHQSFSIDQYKIFRDTHLLPAEDLLMHFHGGEPFIDSNINTICTVIRSTSQERFDLLTNGLMSRENYARILPYKDRIHRVGLTFHRKMIAHIPILVKRFEENVLFLYNAGIPVYVKELLLHSDRETVKEYKRKWKALGVPFKVQDFKGYDRGKDFLEIKEYDIEDWCLIDFEYKKCNELCTCLRGYKTLLIGGHTLGGNVFACFEDMKIVGNIVKNEFNHRYQVKHTPRGIVVEGVPAVYYQDKVFREKGIYKPKGCGND